MICKGLLNMKTLPRTVSRMMLMPILLSILVIPALSQSITSFKFEVAHNAAIAEDIVADIYGDTLIVAIIPYQQTDLNLKATFVTEEAATVMVGEVEQQSTVTINDFSTIVTYVTSGGDPKTYKARLVATGLPLVYVYTEGAAPILNKDDYVPGTIKIYPTDGGDVFTGEMGIRGRGNTTWTLPKKPYRVKLGTAASVLGMPSDKDWVLLANHSDKSLMRNSLAYYLGANMNFMYTPRTTHVDLVLNGVYQGNYVLGEHIKVDKDRVNIEELGEEDIGEDVITGGYFLELDDYRDGFWFELGSGLPFVVKDPEDMPEEQVNYIRNYLQTTEDVINSENFGDPVEGYAKYIDTETFIEWYWVMEVLKNIDAQDVSSIFYYKDRGEKLKMGPLWDLDVAAGNASVNTGDIPTDFYVRESKWFKRLFEDSAFKAKADARWITFKDELLVTLPDVINDFAEKLELSQELNFYKWPILDEIVWPSPTVLYTYDAEVDYLRDWMATRIEWIDVRIERPANEVIGVPELLLPENNEVVEDMNPRIRWFSAHLATEYHVQVSLTEDFETLLVDESGLSDTIYWITQDLTELTTYYWRARALNSEQQSEWSEVRSFTTPVIAGVGENDFGVSMFPNPTSKELYIEIPSVTLIENAELVDTLGRTAAISSLLPGVATRIDVSNLQRGMYVVILRGKIDKPVTSKIVLR